MRILLEVIGHMFGEEDVPASPQSITRCAMLIPAPATLACSFTSITPTDRPAVHTHSQLQDWGVLSAPG